jgi:hypothetical protein
MGKIKIYLSLVDGELNYRDSEEHKGQTITTSVDPGDTITWKLDQCSGIKAITNIKVSGEKGFFKDGPEQKDFDSWKAEVSKKAKGEISYTVSYEACECCGKEGKVVVCDDKLRDEPGAGHIIIRV